MVATPDLFASLSPFHPAVEAWFRKNFAGPTHVQAASWPSIASCQHTLLAAPTGSGKTLAAFLASIDQLVQEGLRQGLPDETRVLYISPLKALSNDIQKNLQQPLLGIRDQLLESGLPDVEVRAWVRTGDTPQWERQKATKQPPHIVVTTPESAYIMMTSDSGRNMLRTVQTVIVDEIHALAGSKRGAHLALSLERLEALTEGSLTRIGCSATQKPIEQMARFLVGSGRDEYNIVDTGHIRDRDLALEIPGAPLEAIMSNEVWQEVYDRLAELSRSHRTTLIFVNTRRLAERAARHLADRIGEENVTAHHGSLSKEHRLKAEQRLKAGNLKCLIATASLELGIDIGDVDLVCQLGTPRSIAGFLQRVGRSGHSVGLIPKGRLFPLSRDDLVECTALLGACHRGELDRIVIPDHPTDVLSQQIVAEISGSEEWEEQALYERFKKAWPYRNLEFEAFQNVVQMLAQGYSTRRGRRGAYLHHDRINGRIRARRGAKLTAVTNGGAIPDQFDYEVILSPEGFRVGTLNEDFAFESLPGDIFQLGNTSYRMLKIEQGRVIVEDAKGEPPNIPFWVGEAPGRTDELSKAVSDLRQQLDTELDQGMESAINWICREYQIPEAAADQLVHYLAGAKAALDLIPDQKRIVFERFFDETGDMHLVIHSPYGSRINRAWGLSLRKRFCRRFNFELQAAALEDSIILSLSASHSFPITEPVSYLNPKTVKDVLIQALLDAPMFPTHWRWVASIALAIKRNHNGKRSPAYFQRNDAEDLVAAVFPDQIACAENLTGRREVPDHPLVTQAIDDCLHDVMDVDGLIRVLDDLEQGNVTVIGKDLNSPSPLSQEILGARPYAFLDDAPAEERRALAVKSRRYMDPAEAADLGRLDMEAIKKVQTQAWPEPRTADELHDALVTLGFLTHEEGLKGNPDGDALSFDWSHLFGELCETGRATKVMFQNCQLWVATERLHEVRRLHPNATWSPEVAELGESWEPETALRELVRSRLEGLGPVTAAELASSLAVEMVQIDQALLALEQEGFVIRGQFRDQKAAQGDEEWCERRLLARIHRYTIKRLRNEIEPVSPAQFMRYLLSWQGLDERGEGLETLMNVIDRLSGFSAPAAAWDKDILPARIRHYTPDQLDALCAMGRAAWARLSVKHQTTGARKASPIKATPICVLERESLPIWKTFSPIPSPTQIDLSPLAEKTYLLLREQGALFFVDLVKRSKLLRTQIEQALGELASWGLVSSDSFAGLRGLFTPFGKRPSYARRGRRPQVSNFDTAGRWHLTETDTDYDSQSATEHIAWTLLKRYGVVFRKVLEREQNLPPWRDLLRVYWRMEARGEIRGGRFVDGFSGEQFALPDAVALLRSTRRQDNDDKPYMISAADPLNLVGIILPGDKISTHIHNRIVLRNGMAEVVQTGADIINLRKPGESVDIEIRALLMRRQAPAGVLKPPARPI